MSQNRFMSVLEEFKMFTVGEVCRRTKLSARMLRHYDSIGLLHPAYTGENGYRYYDEAQLSVIAQIEAFKDYGFSLAEIRELLCVTREELAKRMHARRLKAYGELQAMREKLRLMEDELMKMEENIMGIRKYDVIVIDMPEQKIFGLRKTINISETHKLFEELYDEMEKRGLKRAGATQQMYMGKQFSYDAMDVEAQAIVLDDGEGVKILPAATYAALTHVGPYETLNYAYDAMTEWLGQHEEYEVCGNSIERYIVDEKMAKSAEDIETAIMFPIRKK